MTKRKKFKTTRVGDVRVIGHKRRYQALSDPYHKILTLSWPQFFAVLFCFYLVINLFFGALYWLIPHIVNNATEGNFFDHFFFSVETIATVGYGYMSPANFAAHVIASIEILIGIMCVAIMTGLVFVRFAKPTAKILFSEKAIVGSFDGKPALMIRLANERYNRIVEATAKLSLIRNEINSDGEKFTRIYDMELIRERTPVFALTLTMIHIIDEASPLYKSTAQSLAAGKTRVILNVTGHDETLSASVYASKTYSVNDILFGGRFADILTEGEDDERVVDMTRFQEIEV